MPKGSTIHIHYVCSHEAPLGCLPCNSLLWYAIFPSGQSKHYYPAHRPYVLPSADITICETQGELAVFHTHPPPSLIGSHYTYVILALLNQIQCFLLWTHVDIYFPQAQTHSLSWHNCLYQGLLIPLIFVVFLLVQDHIFLRDKKKQNKKRPKHLHFRAFIRHFCPKQLNSCIHTLMVVATAMQDHGHFDMQTRGIEPATFRWQDAGSTPEPQS